MKSSTHRSVCIQDGKIGIGFNLSGCFAGEACGERQETARSQSPAEAYGRGDAEEMVDAQLKTAHR